MHGKSVPLNKEILFAPYKCVFIEKEFEYKLNFNVPQKNIDSFLKYHSNNVPIIIMINEPSGNLIYSFGFDFSKTPVDKIIKNKTGNISTLLIKKSFADKKSGALINIKNIYGLSDKLDKNPDDE